MKLAKNIQRLGTETAFKILAEAKKLEAEGKKIIHLSLGQPDFKSPKHVVDATKKALDDGHHGYVLPNGIIECRQSVSRKIRNLYNAVDLVMCLSRYDNIPYSIIESMSCGTPNISTNVGGISEVISHKKNGWLLKNNSKEHIKKSIAWSLDSTNYKKISKNSIKDIKKNFSYSATLYNYNKVYSLIRNL